MAHSIAILIDCWETVGDCVLEMGYKVDFTKETDWLKLKNNKYVYLRKRKQ